MASPYFQAAPQARVQIDTSPLQRGAEAQARAMQSIGENVGKLAGVGLNKYFEKKKMNTFIERAAESGQAEDFYKAQKLPMPADVNEIKKDLEAGIKEAGGITAFKAANAADIAQTRAEQKAGQQTEQHNALMEQYGMKMKVLQRAEDDVGRKQKIMGHLYQKGDGNVRNVDKANPWDGFDVTPEMAPQVAAINKELGLDSNRLNALSAWMNSPNSTPGVSTGRKNAPKVFLGRLNAKEHVASFFQQSGIQPKAGDIDALMTSMSDRIADPEKVTTYVQTSFDKIAGGKLKDMSGSYLHQKSTTEALMKEATNQFELQMDEDGEPVVDHNGEQVYKIKNPAAAAGALINVARSFQGTGVLSNQDVALVKGDTSFEGWFKRVYSKFTGNPGAEISGADLRYMHESVKTMTGAIEEVQQRLIPEVYEMARATYGLTDEQIDQVTWLDSLRQKDGGTGGGATGLEINEADVAGVLKALEGGATPEAIAKTFADANPNADPAKVAANIQQIMSTIPKEKLAALGIGENRTAFKGTPFEKEVPRGSAPAGSLQAQVDREGDALVGGAKKTAGYAAAVKAGHVATKIGTGNAAGNMYEVLGQGKVKDLARRKATAASIRNFGGTSASTNAQLLRSMGVGQKDADKALKNGDKAVRSLVRKRIRERAKKFAKNKGAKAVLKKIASPKMIVRGIPVVGWAMLLYDIADLADSATSAPSPEDIKEMTKGMSEAEIDLFKAEYAKLQKDGEISSKVGYFSEGGGWDKRYSFGPR
jgi:hypothetical protein